MSDPIGVDKDGNELTIMDMLSEGGSVIEDVESNILMEKLGEITSKCLTDREYEIVKMRYGLGGVPALTQREVATKFGISRSYVSRIEKHALAKIKERLVEEEFFV